MQDILVVGGGKIGEVIADLLAGSGSYRVTVADQDDARLARLPQRQNLFTATVDVTDRAALERMMRGKFAVLSAAPFFLTETIARTAKRTGVHYLDLTEDVASTEKVRALAADAATAFIPQCGLAPGFISIVAHDLARRFDDLDELRMRVGALPKYPSNGLNYNLTWSTDGLINEYCNPCQAIVDGALVDLPALGDLEEFSLDGVRYEAFNTSGGLGTLCETLADKVTAMNYRSVRYPGHRDIVKVLIQDLKLRDRRDLLRDILEYAVPATMQDVVLVFVTASGRQRGSLMQETYAHKIYSDVLDGRPRSAIQLTTASAICAVLDLLVDGHVPARGFVKQEEISLEAFLANRFGRVYAQQPEHQTAAAAHPAASPAPAMSGNIPAPGSAPGPALASGLS